MIKVLSFLLLSIPSLALADSSTPAKVVAGWVEKISLLPGEDIVKAKLDTGAKTSSINAVDIERFKRDGERWVRFTLSYETARGEKREQSLERKQVRRIRIKEHEGESDGRPVVELDFCFNGRRHKTQFSLVDRSHFIYPVLLGRRFLAGHAVIDPESTFLAQARCDELKDAS